jgi:Fe-S-cluster containining protein
MIDLRPHPKPCTKRRPNMLDCTTCGACCAWSDTWPEFTEEKNILAAGQAVRAEGDPSATACGGKPSGARRSRKVAA